MAELGRWTRGMRAGLGADGAYGAVVPPLYLSTNFTFHGFDEPREYDYTRSGNPTRDVLNDALAVESPKYAIGLAHFPHRWSGGASIPEAVRRETQIHV